MGSFEWMELQTLTAEITAARSRLSAARSRKDHAHVRILQDEIAAAEARRDRMLADISTNLADSGRPPAEAAAQSPPAAADATAERRAEHTEGADMAWEQLTPRDLDNARHELSLRRAETQARHAEEMRALDAEQGELAVLEQAIQSFLHKFSAPAAPVVQLDEKREPRQNRA